MSAFTPLCCSAHSSQADLAVGLEGGNRLEAHGCAVEQAM